ncbi:MAG TPA: amidohydrolase family protein [Chitinophagaceae bacterium]|nr:amidohydrolase family protein [Chitinophagaceae bacterium]
MGYEKVQGDQLFDGEKLWGREKVLVMDSQGRKIDIINAEEAGEDVRYVPGLITPGFVNAHCHVELSHLKDVVPQHTGLVPFLLQVVSKRDFDPQVIQDRIADAIQEMKEDGIIAVGDICNTADSLEQKLLSGMHWQNFVEVLSMTEQRTPEMIGHYNSILSSYVNKSVGRSSLVPHASYTVCDKAFDMINDATEGKLISIHNQETPAEDHLFQTGESDFLELYKFFGINSSPFPATGKSSIRSYLPHFDKGQTIMLVHNTFMPEEDIDWAEDYAKNKGLKLVYCFCVNANLYIENALPPIQKFIDRGCRIVIGTDSYSSNTELKISHEIATIRDRYPSIPTETILKWATVTGADVLGIEPVWKTGCRFQVAGSR